MKTKTSALHSEYIIDGVRMDATPGMMLDIACGKKAEAPENGFEPIMDESLDPYPESGEYDNGLLTSYLESVIAGSRKARTAGLVSSDSFTRSRIAKALIDTLWMRGHFRLDDIRLAARWEWDFSPIGSSAAFYRSVEAACDYLDALGVTLESYQVVEGKKSTVSFEATVSETEDPVEADEDDDSDQLISELPFRTAKPRISRRRICPTKDSGKESGWIVYVPFDTCGFGLGGSLLAKALGNTGGRVPAIHDPDYFIDCFEVMRELVEDGIVISAVSCCDGGLMAAMAKMFESGPGLSADISGIMKSYSQASMVEILFGEVPGVLIEFSDYDYDYVDAELLLQDVAYYPLGHPSKAVKGLKISTAGTRDISGILQSLLSGQASEGED